jgi:hypothetical protein
MEVVRRLRLKAILPRLRRDDEEKDRYPDAAAQTMELEAYGERPRPPETDGPKGHRRARPHKRA